MASLDPSVISAITGTASHIAAPTTSANPTMDQPAIQETLRRDSVFLVLAPVLSTDYTARASAASSPSTTGAGAPITEADPVKKERRSSSVSSGDGLFKRKILKLGPVHGGQRSESDFVELDEE